MKVIIQGFSGTIKVMGVKKFFRWFGLAVLGYALIMALFLIANATVFSLITSNPDKVKAIISDSGVYESIPETIFNSTESKSKDVKEKSALDNQDVKSSALEVFSPGFFENAVGSGLDGTYAWLNGNAEEISFSIDLSKPKEDFISKAVDYRLKTISKLQACSAKQLQGDLDIFTLNCKPPYELNSKKIKQQVRKDISQGEEFLSKDTFTAKELKDENGKTISETLPKLPDQFQAAKKLPLILVFFVGLLAAGIIYISETKKRGLLSLSRIFIVSGIFTIFAPSGIRFLSERILAATSNNQATSDIVQPLVNEFNSATAYIYYWVGGVCILLGALGILAYSGKLKIPKRLNK